MVTDDIPIETFVQLAVNKPPVTELTAGWRIEGNKIEGTLVGAFKDMGIFMVRPTHHRIISDTIVALLKHSPEIQRMVKLAQRDAAMKAQSRHAG